LAEIRPSDDDDPAWLFPPSRAVGESVSGKTETGFHELDEDDESRARKYESEEVRASVQAASSLA